MDKPRASGVEWNMVPPQEFQPCKYRICRTPTKGQLGGVILNQHVLGTGTHYSVGRTQPCFEAGCELCARAIRRDWHGYLFLMGRKSREIIILELTAGPACRLYDEFKRLRTLRGLEILMSRANDQPNGRVICRIGERVANVEELPTVPDIRTMMESIWGVTFSPPTGTEPVGMERMSERDLVVAGVRQRASLNGQTFINSGGID